jgi:tagatose 6-phosphate kinase
VILTVSLNATLNVTYEVQRVSWGTKNHVSRMFTRAGAGGLAIARVLVGLGDDVLAAGFAGGGAADQIEADLVRAGVGTAFTRIGHESRRVVEVLDEERESSTWLTEPAPFITTEELGRFAGEFRKLLSGAEAVVLSGGLPAGLPLDIYASLVSYAAEAGVPAIVHAGGPILWRSLSRHPAMVLAATTAGPPGAGVSTGPAGLVARGAKAAAMLSGASVLAATADGAQWRAALDDYPGLPLSAEAVVAGLVPGVARGWPWPDTLRHAVALGASADPVGEVDLDAYELFSSEVSVDPVGLPAPGSATARSAAPGSAAAHSLAAASPSASSATAGPPAPGSPAVG